MRVEEKKTFTNIQLSDEEWSLYRYIPNVERLKYYVGRMRNCMNMDHVMDHVVLPMLLHELEVTKENSEKRDFYTRLRPFIKHLRGSSGTTLFERITRLNEILKREKRCGQTFAGILQQIKIEPPKLGEEASCIIELIISSSPENSNVISVSPILVGVEYRKKVNQSIGREIGVNVSGRSLQDRICLLYTSPSPRDA